MEPGVTVTAEVSDRAWLFRYASAQRFPWLVADWGTLTVNPMGRKGNPLEQGDVLDFAVRFVMHDGDVAGMWGIFVGEVGVGNEPSPEN